MEWGLVCPNKMDAKKRRQETYTLKKGGVSMKKTLFMIVAALTLCANVSETLPPFEFRVYDEGRKERYHGEEGNDVG